MLSRVIDSTTGGTEAEARRLAGELGLTGAAADQAIAVMRGLDAAFTACDASPIELNPLQVTAAGDLLALDEKMVPDAHSQFRHADLAPLRDETAIHPTELADRRAQPPPVHPHGIHRPL